MDAVASPPRPASAAPGPWIRSPAWDLVWILNPLWLGPLVLVLARGHDDARASPVDALFFALTVALWFGHRVSSAWLAYLTPGYRPLLTTQRLRFVVVPIGVVVACFAVLLAPESVLPLPFEERVLGLAILNYAMVTTTSPRSTSASSACTDRAPGAPPTRARAGSIAASRSSSAAASSSSRTR
jgi:hypothetical protein